MSNQKPRLHLFVIHPKTLTARDDNLSNTVRVIGTAATECGMDILIHQVPQIKPMNILLEEVRSRLEPVPTGFEDIDKMTDSLQMTSELISNWVSHEAAHGFILEKMKNENESHKNDTFLVIEDDAVSVDKNPGSFVEILKHVVSNKQWDMVFLGANIVQTKDNLLNSLSPDVLLTSKESYFIRPDFANKIKENFKQIRSSLRMMFTYIARSYPKTVLGVRKAITLDGSKIGIFPSTLHAHSPPTMCSDYSDLIKLCDQASKENATNARAIFYRGKKTSPDIMYLYGCFLEKVGKGDEAIDVWEDAMELKQKMSGCFGHKCQITKKLLDFYIRKNDESLKELVSLPGKILDYTLAA